MFSCRVYLSFYQPPEYMMENKGSLLRYRCASFVFLLLYYQMQKEVNSHFPICHQGYRTISKRWLSPEFHNVIIISNLDEAISFMKSLSRYWSLRPPACWGYLTAPEDKNDPANKKMLWGEVSLLFFISVFLTPCIQNMHDYKAVLPSAELPKLLINEH